MLIVGASFWCEMVQRGGVIGNRCADLGVVVVSAFFDYAFMGKKDKLLRGPSTEFPEVSFMKNPGSGGKECYWAGRDLPF